MDDGEEDEEDYGEDEPLHWVDCNETEQDLAKMQRLLSRNPSCLNSHHPANSNATPLFRAVSYGHPVCVEFLLNAGADPNLDSPTAPVHISIFGDLPDITEILLKNGASANANAYANRCAYIVSAARIRAVDTVRLLLDYGAFTEDLDYLQSYKDGIADSMNSIQSFFLGTPLAIAALEGDLAIFRLLLLRGALPTIHTEQHNVVQAVQDAHSVPRLLAHECTASTNTKCRILRTFHQFGGDPLQRLRNGKSAYSKHKQRNKDLRALATDLSGTPRTLMAICRLVVLRAIGKDYLNRVQLLRGLLPKTVCDFLEFPEEN
ncbi:ankyrin repeat and SOCS box protein 12-like [Neocloeon triangulifer]|uniref:ankyrin repeat and SOCS box protein 12-like n=1 Tax=Neocloeon triangulifer TaxID=2078957 RepID=UPI00286F3521|nr:ankyrin repeat and SOCS box protein 12-like [Neocloeon triangulifer]